jgi:hypothetical protein
MDVYGIGTLASIFRYKLSLTDAYLYNRMWVPCKTSCIQTTYLNGMIAFPYYLRNFEIDTIVIICYKKSQKCSKKRNSSQTIL